MKRIIPVALAVMAVTAAACKQKRAMPQDNYYPTLKVELQDKTLQTNYSASIKGKQDVDVYPQITGTITNICITEGARVHKGQALFIIDQVPYRAALETACANKESAAAAVATAQMTLDSKQELFKEKVVSSFDLRSAQNSLQSKKASLDQARADLLSAQNNLSYTVIKSPVDGAAGMITYKKGALVGPSIASPLVSVSDDNEVYAYFSLTEKQIIALSRQNGGAGDLAAAMPAVSLKLSDGSDYDLKGKVDAVSGLVDKSTGAVTVRAVFANPKHILRSGSSGSVVVPVVSKNCIVIPQSATYELQDKYFVYKVVNGKTQSAEIKIMDLNDGKNYIVESGLKQGDVIIADGAGLLKEGMPVSTQKPKAEVNKK